MIHVIIGAGPAGVVAADTLRKCDPEAKITIIGEEPEPPYSRMAIPYFLVNKIDESGTYLRRSKTHYDKAKIEVLQDRVDSVDSQNKQLKLTSGNTKKFDKLLIATGASPLTPAIPGIDSPGVHSCWTLSDARQIVALAQAGSNVVLMGAGFIGCIILQALAARGVNLTVVEMENRMVPRMMNDISGGLIKKWCQGKGLSVLTATKVMSINPQQGEHKLNVALDNGTQLPADLVISATGVKSNIDFLKDTEIETDQGIVVDHYLQTSLVDIYAAGDCAQGKDFSTGGFQVQAIQPTAVEHGRLAANNMVKGHEAPHPGNINMNVLDTMGLVSSSFGLWQGAGGDSAELIDADRFRYLNLQFKDDILIGASALGLTEHVGVIRGLIQTKVRLGHWKQRLLNDPTQLMEAYLGSTQGIGLNADVLG